MIENCTISTNASSDGGGGITSSSGMSVANSIVAGNISQSEGDADVSGIITSLGNNLIGQIDDASVGWISSDLTGTPSAPINPGLSPLGDHGGPTPTMLLLADALIFDLMICWKPLGPSTQTTH